MGDAHKKLRWLIHKWLRNWKKKISSQYSLCTFTLMLFLRFIDGWNELHINLLYYCLWLIYKEKFFLRRCSLSCVTWMLFSRILWWLERKVSFTKLVDNQKWEMPNKFHDDRTIDSWVIEERRFRHNIPCAPSPWCCSWGSSDGRNEFSCI